MEKLTYGVLKRRGGRIDKFLTKFKDEKEFVFVDGTSAKIDKVIIGNIEYSSSDADTTLKAIFNSLPKIPTLKIKVGTNTIAFGKLAKTSEFGGQGSGSTGTAWPCRRERHRRPTNQVGRRPDWQAYQPPRA